MMDKLLKQRFRPVSLIFLETCEDCTYDEVAMNFAQVSALVSSARGDSILEQFRIEITFPPEFG